ncbi:hypothetical protein lerEdw1_000584 [Lerista edwardsae]|nr:hypothetical protein lerEdw1_000584 [Lerista edwardsae]
MLLFYRWQKIFMISLWNKIANYWNKAFLAIIILLIVLFLGNVLRRTISLITQLASETSAHKALEIQVAETNEAARKLLQENEKLQESLKERKNSEDHGISHETNKELRQEVEELKTELEKSTNALSKTTDEITVLKMEHERLEKEYDNLREEHKKLQDGEKHEKSL